MEKFLNLYVLLEILNIYVYINRKLRKNIKMCEKQPYIFIKIVVYKNLCFKTNILKNKKFLDKGFIKVKK